MKPPEIYRRLEKSCFRQPDRHIWLGPKPARRGGCSIAGAARLSKRLAAADRFAHSPQPIDPVRLPQPIDPFAATAPLTVAAQLGLARVLGVESSGSAEAMPRTQANCIEFAGIYKLKSATLCIPIATKDPTQASARRKGVLSESRPAAIALATMPPTNHRPAARPSGPSSASNCR